LEPISVADEHGVEQLAAAVLAEALVDDPFYAAITIDFETDDVARRAALMGYFLYSLREGYRTGAVVIPAGDPFGAAIWTLPQQPDVAQQAAAAKHAAFAALLGPRGFDNYRAILAFMGPAAQAVIPAHTWYLSILGVAPHRQGRGLGRALLEPTLRRADQTGSCCFLETFNSATLGFYRRLGFAEVAEQPEPTTGARYWIMLREPQFGEDSRRAAS
jgi:ribosomal protein S18 acetylase RimI-like enzyme